MWLENTKQKPVTKKLDDDANQGSQWVTFQEAHAESTH